MKTEMKEEKEEGEGPAKEEEAVSQPAEGEGGGPPEGTYSFC